MKNWDYNIINKFWFLKKHPDVMLTNYDKREFRDLIINNSVMSLNPNPDLNFILNWHGFENKHVFPYDYENNEIEIQNLLLNSDLLKCEDLLVEMPSYTPTVKCKSLYFANNWLDFVDANLQMGCIVSSIDFNFIMEFTDDEHYLLYSNFKIR